MGEMIFIVSNGRVAKTPVLFTDPADETKNHLAVTVIVNGPKNKKTGERSSDTMNLAFWGGKIAIATSLLKVGTRFNAHGILKSFLAEGPMVDGKPFMYEKTEARVEWFELGGRNQKEIEETADARIAALKAAGRIPANCTVTGKEICAPDFLPIEKYNKVTAEKTGMQGFAKVWIKGKGFVQNPTAVPPAAAQVGTTSIPEVLRDATPAEVEMLRETLAKQGLQLPGLPAVATASPFDGVAALAAGAGAEDADAPF